MRGRLGFRTIRYDDVGNEQSIGYSNADRFDHDKMIRCNRIEHSSQQEACTLMPERRRRVHYQSSFQQLVAMVVRWQRKEIRFSPRANVCDCHGFSLRGASLR